MLNIEFVLFALPDVPKQDSICPAANKKGMSKLYFRQDNTIESADNLDLEVILLI
jgi:hypothetical protein